MTDATRASGSADDPYWTEDVEIGEGVFWREVYRIRMRVHREIERYHRPQEIVPDLQASGERIYVQATPYVLVPDITIEVGLSPHPSPTGAVGEVTSSDWRGMRQVEVGRAQAWYYPADRTLILWECCPFERDHAGADPAQNAAWAALWKGFEQFLVAHLSDVGRIITPAWDPEYERVVWQAFLRALGYDRLSEAAFVKVSGA